MAWRNEGREQCNTGRYSYYIRNGDDAVSKNSIVESTQTRWGTRVLVKEVDIATLKHSSATG